MKPKSRTAPLRQENDTLAMNAAIEALEARGVEFFRPHGLQLKIGSINFYPDTGTIMVDGGKKLQERGLEAFLLMVDQSTNVTKVLSLDDVLPKDAIKN
jgi:hypothetical protein